MQLKAIASLLTLTVVSISLVEAQIYDTNNIVVQTFAGSGFSGYVDGQGASTMFNVPLNIVADSQGDLFVNDHNNFRIRRITPTGAVSTFAGGGTSGLPGYGTNVSFGNLAGPMAIDHSNVLWLTEYIYSGCFTLVRVGCNGYATSTNLPVAYNSVGGMCVDSGNNIYFSDQEGNRIYRYQTDGALGVFAGSGNSGSVDGNGVFTSFTGPQALAVDAADNIYVYDSGNHVIRRIDQSQNVVTIAGNKSVLWGTGVLDSDGVGTSASFYDVCGMCADSFGNIFLACNSVPGGCSVRKMTAATNVTTLAGSFAQYGYTNGVGSVARFDFSDSGAVCISGNTIFVADPYNQRIRQITFNPAPQPVAPANLQLSTFPGLTINGIVGRTYQIQSSPDMTTWSTTTTLLLTSSPHLWIDQNSVSGNKFYRALLLP